MKKILLLGDSIRLSYQDAVKQKLDGVADVFGPDDNGRFAKYTYWYCAKWVEECGPDIIHWNNGIWDTYLQHPDMGLFTPIEEYVSYLGKVLHKLNRSGAQIIWAATTPVNPACKECRNEDIDRYNAAAAELMQTEGIPINDLNAVLKPDLDGSFDEDHLHLSAAGVEACAEAVVRAVRDV